MVSLIYGLRAVAAKLFLLALLACTADTPPRAAMIAAAHPLAVDAGLAMLAKGGSAVDAAIAVQMMLNLVEPQSSGIGGGGFLLHWDEQQKKISVYDGRETAPAGTQPDIFMKEKNIPQSFIKAVIGGQSVGVPGLVAMLAAIHEKHGRLPWKQLFEPAIKQARQGFPISRQLAFLIARDPFLKKSPAARKLFFKKTKSGLRPRREGGIIKNPDFANILTLLAEKKSKGFYRGALAQKITKAVGGYNGFSRQDLASYQPKTRDVLCRPYRRYKICAMPPPSSGGLTLLQILGIVEHFDLAQIAPQSAQAVHLISEASRLAYADRGHYIADPDFFPVPINAMLAPDYLRRRAQQISLDKAQSKISAGHLLTPRPPSQDERAQPSTTHFSIIDHHGNAVALTSSIEGPFGSHIMVGGFFLNNEMTDFSFRPRRGSQPIANAVAAGKRPLSSMTPTFVFAPDGKLFAVIGSPGGRRIIAYVAQTVIALIDWQKSMQEAISLPRHVALGSAHRKGDIVEVEIGTKLEALAPQLEKIGHQVKAIHFTSGLHGIRIVEGNIDGGADPRRDGVAKKIMPSGAPEEQ